MVAELQQAFRCPHCGHAFEIRPVQGGHASPAAAPSQTQPRRMTANQESLIEDYCCETQQPFPQGFSGFSVEQASNWIELNVPPEYIAWRRRKLYGSGKEGP